MILVGSKDIGPTNYLIEYTKNLNEVYWIKTNKNKELIKKKILIKLIIIKKKSKINFNRIVYNSGLDKKLIEFGLKEKN